MPALAKWSVGLLASDAAPLADITPVLEHRRRGVGQGGVNLTDGSEGLARATLPVLNEDAASAA